MRFNLISKSLSATKNTFIAFFILVSISTSFPQVVYEPLHRDVYNFLARLSQKGVLEFHDEIRPIARKYILEKLFEADDSSDQLTSLEKEELKFFIEDFYHEAILKADRNREYKHTNFFGHDPAGRWRFFSYRSDAFKVNLSLILGAEMGSLDKEKRTHFWNGFYTYGYISNSIGVSFDFRDNTESGATIDKDKQFSPITGVNERSNHTIVDYPPDKIEYSEAKGIIATDWSWGTFAVGKDFLEWGYGDNGLLVLSQKPPSYPFIRLDISPVDWFGFNYFHGWLASDVVDSTEIYYTDTGGPRFLFRNKYIASHTLTLRPVKGLSISLGESMVYSDKLEILYLIPVSFFRLADHYLSRQNNAAGNNAQFFASVSSRGQIINTHLYATLFIDEITLNGLFDSYSQRNQIGFTVGSSITDLPFENLTAKLEYSKTYPYTYEHFIPTTTYASANYSLGHWMGSNADQVYGSLKYRFLRGLEAKVWARFIRQGEKGDVEGQYEQPQPPFLFGMRTNHTYFGASVKYEILHELFFRARFQFAKTSTQQTDRSFTDKNINEFHFAVYYGL